MQNITTIKFDISKFISSFRHDLPLQLYTAIFDKHFSAKFFDNFFRPLHAHFLKTIKCIQYSLLLIENYSQVIFDKISHNSTALDSIRVVYCIHQDYSPKNVEACINLSKYVEDCRSLSDYVFLYFIPLIIIYHLFKN